MTEGQGLVEGAGALDVFPLFAGCFLVISCPDHVAEDGVQPGGEAYMLVSVGVDGFDGFFHRVHSLKGF